MAGLNALFGIPGPKVFYYSLSGLRTVGEEDQTTNVFVQNPLAAAKPSLVLEDSGIAGLPLIRRADEAAAADDQAYYTIPSALFAPTQELVGILLDLLAS